MHSTLSFHFRLIMLSSSLTKLVRPSLVSRQASRGMAKLPKFDPAADLPMSYGIVYLGITLGFSALGECQLQLDRDLYILPRH